MRVLVLGGTGMLGHMVVDVLSRLDAVMVEGTHRGAGGPEGLRFEADGSGGGLLELVRRRGGYDYVINCIGVLAADIDEQDSESVVRALRINAEFPHALAKLAPAAGFRIIHISTDGVFSGRAEEYGEDSPRDCPDVYGKTKALGEVLAPRCVTIRCSIVGPDPIRRRGLLEWFLSQPDGKQLTGFTDVIWNGVTTLQLAELCGAIITRGCFDALWDESRVHHFCPNSAVSKYELLRVFQAVFRKKVEIVPSQKGMGSVRKVLVTRFEGLHRLVGHGLSMETAIGNLATYMARSS
ncbi:MAG: dTDP-4-dehydrorhamnose reductase family protein [Nitrospirota bacterium]